MIHLAGSALVLGLALANVPAGAPGAAAPPAASRVQLREDLSDANPRGFARRLSAVLGIEVRLPDRGFQKLTLRAGEWKATDLLDAVAKQVDGSWGQRFVFSPAGKPPTPGLLPSPGRLFMVAPPLSFAGAARLLGEAAACEVELPDRLPPGRFRLDYRGVPAERAFADLAARGGLSVARVVVFQTEAGGAEAGGVQERRLARETAAKAVIANRLCEAYGPDLEAADFPWDGIDTDAFLAALAPELDLTPREARDLLAQIRAESLALANR